MMKSTKYNEALSLGKLDTIVYHPIYRYGEVVDTNIPNESVETKRITVNFKHLQSPMKVGFIMKDDKWIESGIAEVHLDIRVNSGTVNKSLFKSYQDMIEYYTNHEDYTLDRTYTN